MAADPPSVDSPPAAAPGDERESGLVVVVPEAEPVVRELRLRHDQAAKVGVPAHVTVLYPFLPPGEVSQDVEQSLAELFASMSAFDYHFARVGRFGDSNIHLEPEPAAAFSALVAAVSARWPGHPPYGGRHETVIPHLTVGDQLPPGTADALAREVGERLTRHGPLTGRCRQVELMSEERGGRWSTVGRYPLRDA